MMLVMLLFVLLIQSRILFLSDLSRHCLYKIHNGAKKLQCYLVQLMFVVITVRCSCFTSSRPQRIISPGCIIIKKKGGRGTSERCLLSLSPHIPGKRHQRYTTGIWKAPEENVCAPYIIPTPLLRLPAGAPSRFKSLKLLDGPSDLPWVFIRQSGSWNSGAQRWYSIICGSVEMPELWLFRDHHRGSPL